MPREVYLLNVTCKALSPNGNILCVQYNNLLSFNDCIKCDTFFNDH